MLPTTSRVLGAAALVLGLSGCPLTDDYYIAPGETSSRPSAGSGGSAPTGGVDAGGSAAGTTAGKLGAGGDPKSDGGAPATEPCVPETERCNGHDDDCDGFADEMACGVQSTVGCVGFTLAERDDHGYMLCSGSNKRDFEDAGQACQGQDMRLAWIESEPENRGVADKIDALGGATEVLFGGSDRAKEGDWHWVGGNPFWKGDADGNSVDDAFEAWADSTPNNANDEDCIVLYPDSATWGDRNCDASYAYLCEEREPFE